MRSINSLALRMISVLASECIGRCPDPRPPAHVTRIKIGGTESN